MEKMIGVLGGMGPMASQLFYKMITEMTEASCDQEHLKMMIFSDTSMPDRTKAILSGDIEPVREKLLEDAKLLQQCGCKAIGITCNTAHYFADLIQDQLEVPIIHMIKETVNTIAESMPGAKVALLATDGTVRTRIYQGRMEKAGLEPYILPDEMQKQVMYQIYDRIKSGKPWDAENWAALEAHIKEAGCSCAIMGCTELSVIKMDNRLDDYYVDPMAVLAERLILFAGKQIKQNQ